MSDASANPASAADRSLVWPASTLSEKGQRRCEALDDRVALGHRRLAIIDLTGFRRIAELSRSEAALAGDT